MGEQLWLILEHLWSHASDDGSLRVLLVVESVLVLVPASPLVMSASAIIVIIVLVLVSLLGVALALGSSSTV